MKALLVVGPALGVFKHMLGLAEYLREIGIEPTILTGHSMLKHLTEIESGTKIILSPLYDIDFARSESYFDQSCSESSLKKIFEHLCGLIIDNGYEYIVSKYHIAPSIVAKYLKLPHSYYFTDGPSFLTTKTTPQTNISESVRSAVHINSFVKSLGLPQRYETLEEVVSDTSLNLVRGTPLSEGVSVKTLNKLHSRAQYTGLLFFDSSKRKEGEHLWNEGIGGHKVFCSLGTMCSKSQSYREILDGIPEQFSLLCTAPALNTSLVGKHRVLSHVPVAAVIKESSIVVHHGGHGTMLEAMSVGVPQLIIPQNKFTAQSLHGRRVEELGIGIKLNSDISDLTKKVNSSVRHLLDSKTVLLARETGDRFLNESKIFQQELKDRLATQIGVRG